MATNTSSAETVAGSRQRVRVGAEEQRPVDALLRAVLADRLAGGDDVVLVERARQRRAAMAGRPERDALLGLRDVRVLGVVRGDQVGDVDEIIGTGGLPSAGIGHAAHPGTAGTVRIHDDSDRSRDRRRRPRRRAHRPRRDRGRAGRASPSGTAAIGAFQVVRAEAALREADAVDQRTDRFSLPLAGVPIAIKDNVPVSGEPMRIGSAGSDPDAAASSTTRSCAGCARAGAVVVGLTRVPELCVFGATDSTFGITRNPWDLERTPGGSSGGAAAAVAAGMVAVAHGNDGMGSIRIPSACCGLVGIKPGPRRRPGRPRQRILVRHGRERPARDDRRRLRAACCRSWPGDPSWPRSASPARLRIAVSTRNPIAGFPVDRGVGRRPRATPPRRCARPATPCGRPTRPTASGSGRPASCAGSPAPNWTPGCWPTAAR